MPGRKLSSSTASVTQDFFWVFFSRRLYLAPFDSRTLDRRWQQADSPSVIPELLQLHCSYLSAPQENLRRSLFTSGCLTQWKAPHP